MTSNNLIKAAVVPAHALPAWSALIAALRDIPPPCALDAETWWSSDTQLAQRACLRCPALTECATYATTAPERYGVWGGTDRERRSAE